MPSGYGLLWNSDALKLHRPRRGNISRDLKEVPFTYHLFFFLTSTTGFPTAIPSHLKKRLRCRLSRLRRARGILLYFRGLEERAS